MNLSHIDWRREQVLARMLGPEGGGLWDLTFVGEENNAFFIRLWKPLPNKRVLKTLRGSPKVKIQRGQYLLAVCLDGYNLVVVSMSGRLEISYDNKI